MDRISECAAIFKKSTGVDVPIPEIGYDQHGRIAGMAYGSRRIDFNPDLFANNESHFVKQTVPHEFAHICADYFYVKTLKQSISSHGVEWKNVMRLFKCKPDRCHSYDTSEVHQKRDMTKHLYTCTCKHLHFLSPKKAAIAHRFTCKKCHGSLVFVEIGKMSILTKKYKKSQ
jgi:SprT protein